MVSGRTRIGLFTAIWTALVVAAAVLAVCFMARGGSTAVGSDRDTPHAATVTVSGSPYVPPWLSHRLTKVTCWNGQRRYFRVDCPAPSGLSGLKWAFSSFSPDTCTKISASTYRCRDDSAGAVFYDTHFYSFKDEIDEGRQKPWVINGTYAGELYDDYSWNGLYWRTAIYGHNGAAVEVGSSTPSGRESLWKEVRARALSSR